MKLKALKLRKGTIVFNIFLVLTVIILFQESICTSTATSTTTSTSTSTATKTATKTHTRTKTTTKTSTNSQSKFSTNLNLSFRQKLVKVKSHRNPTDEVKDLIAQTSGVDIVQKLHEQGTAYWEGWVKYFKIIKGEKPKSFFKNFSYQKQMKENPNIDVNLKEKGIYKFIPDDNQFFISLQGNNINIANSREDKMQTHFDAVAIDNIGPIEEGLSYSGGIQDFGSFSEGFCFKVITTAEKLRLAINSKMKTVEFVFCCSTKEDKLQFMGILKALKLKKQKEDGIVINGANLEEKKKSPNNFLQSLIKNTSSESSPISNSQDGRWVILQNWSQCSLKCGGGETVLHRFCIPPIGDGKPCQGESIIRKPCNTQPCKTYIEKLKKNKVVVEAPIVKVLPFSNRPQRFVKCKVKEADVMMFRDLSSDNSSKSATSIHKVLAPVRVVMNNFTLSIFESANYYSNLLTFDLEQTNFLSSKEHKWCFILQQKSQEAELCSYSMKHKDTSFVEEWSYDFELFKGKCRVEKATNEVTDDINYRLKTKMMEIEKEMENEKKNVIQEREKDAETNLLAKRITDTAELTFKALKKETSLEEMIKNEEEQKIKERQRKLKGMLEKEEEKKKQLDERIKEKELETETILESEERELNIKEAKKEAAEILLEKRNKLKKTVAEMRKKSELEESQLQSKILKLRSQIATEMTDANRKGDAGKCRKGLENRENREAYCKVSFETDYVNYAKCIDEADFCSTCCEKEFGEMFMQLRTECLKDFCYK